MTTNRPRCHKAVSPRTWVERCGKAAAMLGAFTSSEDGSVHTVGLCRHHFNALPPTGEVTIRDNQISPSYPYTVRGVFRKAKN